MTTVIINVSGGVADANWVDKEGVEQEVELGEISSRWVYSTAKEFFIDKTGDKDIEITIVDLD